MKRHTSQHQWGSLKNVGGVLSISIGLILLLSGRKLFKPFLWVNGCLVGIFGAYFLIEFLDKHSSLSNLQENYRNGIEMLLFTALGFVGGALSVTIWKAGLYIAGASAGGLLGRTLTAQSDIAWLKIVGPIIGSILFIILIGLLENVILSFASSLIGAFMIILGYDAVINKSDLLRIMMSKGIVKREYYGKYMLTILVLLLIGCLVQMLFAIVERWRRPREHRQVDLKSI